MPYLCALRLYLLLCCAESYTYALLRLLLLLLMLFSLQRSSTCGLTVHPVSHTCVRRGSCTSCCAAAQQHAAAPTDGGLQAQRKAVQYNVGHYMRHSTRNVLQSRAITDALTDPPDAFAIPLLQSKLNCTRQYSRPHTFHSMAQATCVLQYMYGKHKGI
jgi:hypothetical protein